MSDTMHMYNVALAFSMVYTYILKMTSPCLPWTIVYKYDFKFLTKKFMQENMYSYKTLLKKRDFI